MSDVVDKKLSGQQRAALAVEEFNAWVEANEGRCHVADENGELPPFINPRNGKTNKEQLQHEFSFGKSAFAQNPAIKAALGELDARLAENFADRASVNPSTVAESEFARQQALTKARATDKSLKALQDQNALLITENKSLRQELVALEEMRTARRAFLETTLNHGRFKSARGGE